VHADLEDQLNALPVALKVNILISYAFQEQHMKLSLSDSWSGTEKLLAFLFSTFKLVAKPFIKLSKGFTSAVLIPIIVCKRIYIRPKEAYCYHYSGK
jgi:hypothetical protein